jgi:hypothetical protein
VSRRRPLRRAAALLAGAALLGVAAGAARRRMGGVTPVSRDDPRLDVRLAAPGVVRGSVSVGVMRSAVARPFCESIEELALREGADALVMDMSSLSKATPPAGLYAIRRLRRLPLRRIALLRGSRFMRGFAGAVLTAGRFPEFRFFDSEETAVQWASARRSL